MCYAKPGPRCSRHAVERLMKATNNLKAAKMKMDKAEKAVEKAGDDLRKIEAQKEMASVSKQVARAEKMMKSAKQTFDRSVTERDKSIIAFKKRRAEYREAKQDFDTSPAGIEELRTGVVKRIDGNGKLTPTGQTRPIDVEKAEECEAKRKEKIEATKQPAPQSTRPVYTWNETPQQRLERYDRISKAREKRDAEALAALAERRAAAKAEQEKLGPDTGPMFGPLSSRQVEAMREAGGSTWEKHGHQRVYFSVDKAFEAAGGYISYHKSGNISSVSLPGVDGISNNRAYGFNNRIFYDAVKKKWSGTGDDEVDAYLTKSLSDQFGIKGTD